MAVAARSTDDLEQTCKRVEGHGKRAIAVAMDVTEIESIESGVERAVLEFGRLDILITSAGINEPAPALQIKPDSWDRHFSNKCEGKSLCRTGRSVGVEWAEYGITVNVIATIESARG